METYQKEITKLANEFVRKLSNETTRLAIKFANDVAKLKGKENENK